jgi:hypothetical protein
MSGWPENPLDLFEPYDITVVCDGGAEHVVRWDRGVVTCTHDQSSQIVGALGGELSACEQVAQVWRTSPSADLGDNSITYLRFTEGLPAQVAEGLPEEVADEFVARMGVAGAVRRLATQELRAWLQDLGATEPFHLEVGVFAPPAPNSGDVAMVGGRAEWGHGLPTRAVVTLTSDWYDAVRTHGLVVDGMFNLGENADGLVVLRPRLSHGTERPVAWGALHNEYALRAGAAEAFRAAAATPPPTDPGDSLFVAGFHRWEPEQYTLHLVKLDALEPDGLVAFTNLADAEAWCRATNVHETFIGGDPDMVPQYYDTELLGGVPHDFDPDSPPAALLEIAARFDVDPARWSVKWTSVCHVTYEQN